MAEDLSNFTPAGDVLLGVCAADSLPQLMLDRSAKKVSVRLLVFVDKTLTFG